MGGAFVSDHFKRVGDGDSCFYEEIADVARLLCKFVASLELLQWCITLDEEFVGDFFDGITVFCLHFKLNVLNIQSHFSCDEKERGRDTSGQCHCEQFKRLGTFVATPVFFCSVAENFRVLYCYLVCRRSFSRVCRILS